MAFCFIDALGWLYSSSLEVIGLIWYLVGLCRGGVGSGKVFEESLSIYVIC